METISVVVSFRSSFETRSRDSRDKLTFRYLDKYSIQYILYSQFVKVFIDIYKH